MYMGFYLLDRVHWLQSHPLPSWKIYIHFWYNLPKMLESQALPPVYKKASIIPITVHVRVCTCTYMYTMWRYDHVYVHVHVCI